MVNKLKHAIKYILLFIVSIFTGKLIIDFFKGSIIPNIDDIRVKIWKKSESDKPKEIIDKPLTDEEIDETINQIDSDTNNS